MNINSKESYYNFMVDASNGEQVIYNTKTGAIDIIEPDSKEIVQTILKTPDNIPDTFSELYDYMLKQGYVVEQKKDELKDIIDWYQAADNSEDTAYLTVLPTETCNFTCPYCFIYTFREKHMDPKIYDNIYKYIEKFFEKNKDKEYCVFGLSWFGGEPLLVVDKILAFMDRLHALKQIYPNAVLKSEITTNGYYLTYELFSKLLEAGIDRYQVTLDGDAENHDKLRTLSNKRPTFDTIYQNILEIKKKVPDDKQFQFVIRSNFLRSSIKNSEHLLEMYKRDFGDENRFRIYFRPVYNFETDRDDILELESDLCGNEEGVIIQNRLTIDTLEGTENVLEKVANPLPMPTESWCVSVRHNSNIVGYDGSVFSCDTMIVEKDKAIGIMDDNGDIVLNEKAKLWKKSIFELRDTLGDQADECIKCKLLPVCMGGCNRARHVTGKNPCFWTEDLIHSAMVEYGKIYSK